MVLGWAERLQAALQALPDRPRRLLVIVNPFGGAKEAMRTWEHSVAPVFAHAGAALLPRHMNGFPKQGASAECRRASLHVEQTVACCQAGQPRGISWA